MPKIKNLAALVAAVEGARRYARSNPDKAAKYIDQAAAFLDKQTKGKYHGQVEGVVGKVKGAGLPQSSGNGTQSGEQVRRPQPLLGRHLFRCRRHPGSAPSSVRLIVRRPSSIACAVAAARSCGSRSAVQTKRECAPSAWTCAAPLWCE